MIALHQHYPANVTGRDFIVGDLHGCLDLLQTELERIAFEPDKDRLFSVGDLADRGPDSMGCLRLLNQPWFYAVRGNHEDMLINDQFHVVMPYGHNDAGAIFRHNGGGWVDTLTEAEHAELREELVPQVVRLPYVITVGEGAAAFHVAHAELMTGTPEEDSWWDRLNAPAPGSREKRILTDAELTHEVLSQMKIVVVK